MLSLVIAENSPLSAGNLILGKEAQQQGCLILMSPFQEDLGN